jgi:Fe-S cluster assembly iron-binding protein IscA
MLNVTETAAGQLADLLDQNNAPQDAAVRLVRNASGVSMQIDNPRTDDVTFEYDAKTVLVLDQEMSELLSDRTLDIEETEQGIAFALR